MDKEETTFKEDKNNRKYSYNGSRQRLALRMDKEETTFKEDKNNNRKYSYNGSRQRLACSFMPACLRCRTLVDTNVLLYELCCYVQGRLKVVLLCLRYVDTGFRSLVCACEQKRSTKQVKKKAKKAKNFGKVLFPNN